MNTLKQTFSKSVIAGIGFSMAVLLTSLVYATITNVSSGQTLTSDKMNEVINALNGGIVIPTGAIMAFNGSSCPTGWLPANGNNLPKVGGGTNSLDLRGRFLRGMNSFESGANLISTGSGDPDGLRIIGDYQSDDLKSHDHNLQTRAGTLAHSAGVYPSSADAGTIGDQGNSAVLNTGGAESRPRNIAVLFCVKQ